MQKEKVIAGGKSDSASLKIEPTVMDGVTWQDSVMQEEIFGPVLPVLTFNSYDEIYGMLSEKPKPLAFYIYTQNKKLAKKLTAEFSFGGGCINDCIIHLATNNMGFGGVGESGMGAYHGKIGFDTFSHKKSIVDKKTWIDLFLRYQPYSKLKEKILHIFLK